MSVQPSHFTLRTTLLVQSSLAICVQHLLASNTGSLDALYDSTTKV